MHSLNLQCRTWRRLLMVKGRIRPRIGVQTSGGVEEMTAPQSSPALLLRSSRPDAREPTWPCMSPNQVTQIHTALGIRTAAGLLSHTPRSLSPARPMAMSTINPLPQMTRQGILQTRHTPPAMQSIAHCTHSSPARRHRECQFLLISPHPLAQEFASPINVAKCSAI